MKARLEQDLGEKLPSIIEMTSVCGQFRKCKDSLVTFKVNEEVNHKCLHAICKHCLEYVNIYDHQCFITSKEEKHFKRTMRKLRQQKKKKEQLLAMVVEGLTDDHTQMIIDHLIAKRKKKLKELKEISSGIPMAEIKARREEDRLNDLREEVMEQLMEEGVDIDAMTLDMVNERMSKLQDNQQVGQSLQISTNGLVFADLECILHSTNTFIPIMICYALRDNDTIFHHWGTNCVQAFIKTILNWSKERKKEAGAQDMTIFFHNLKGFDGIFMMDALYKLNLKVTDIMGTGTKMLHFKHKNLVFKDSLSFLNMPQTNFTNTFGLRELKKGWFPHKFSKLENFHYEGTIPDLHYYEPQDTSKDKKKACEDWHAKQVLNGEVWNFKKELLSYCESDVKLLKEGCLKFAEDTMRDAGFNPLTQ